MFELIHKIVQELKKADKDANKMRLAAWLAELSADLQEKDVQVPTSIFDAFDNEGRVVVLQAWLVLMSQTMNE